MTEYILIAVIIVLAVRVFYTIDYSDLRIERDYLLRCMLKLNCEKFEMEKIIEKLKSEKL